MIRRSIPACPHLSRLDVLDGLRCPCRRSISPDDTPDERRLREQLEHLRDSA